jgi:hypothetical protein
LNPFLAKPGFGKKRVGKREREERKWVSTISFQGKERRESGCPQFPHPGSVPRQLNVILNWSDELDRLVPAGKK